MTLDGFHSCRHCSNKFAEEDTQPLAPALAGRTPVAAVRRGQNRPRPYGPVFVEGALSSSGFLAAATSPTRRPSGGWTLVRYRARRLESLLPAPIRARWPRTRRSRGGSSRAGPRRTTRSSRLRLSVCAKSASAPGANAQTSARDGVRARVSLRLPHRGDSSKDSMRSSSSCCVASVQPAVGGYRRYLIPREEH